MLKQNLQSHWNKIYERSPIDKMGWYEEDPEPSLSLINKYLSNKDSRILNVGAGASMLVDRLLEEGYEAVIANDLSLKALKRLKSRLGLEEHKVEWIIDDLTKPHALLKLYPVNLWHDRAVLHFFNDEEAQTTYFNLLRLLVAKDGIAIIAAFNLDGADNCSGLPVHRYNKEMLQSGMGPDFELLDAFNHTYTMPSGDTSEYIYTVFKRKG